MAHIVGIVVTAERKMMLCLQPAMVGGAELYKGSEFDHGIFLSSASVIETPDDSRPVSPKCFRSGAKAAVDVEHRAGHERRLGAGEEDHAGGDLFGGAKPLQRVLGALGLGE